MAVNKVEVDGEVKLDLTQDTVTPEALLPGATAHNAAGEQIAGTAAAVLYTDQTLTADQQAQARSNIGAASGLESADYPGCYYNTLTDGAVEWINPPMALGTEYRTTERYLGKPVYEMVMDCGIVPTTGEKDVPLTNVTNSDHVVSAFFEAYADAGFKQSVPNSTLTAYWLSGSHGTAIRIAATTDAWNVNNYHVYAHLKYTKTTD